MLKAASPCLGYSLSYTEKFTFEWSSVYNAAGGDQRGGDAAFSQQGHSPLDALSCHLAVALTQPALTRSTMISAGR
jgi:hypothetical protein